MTPEATGRAEPLRYIFCELPRCQSCGESHFGVYKTVKSGDGSKLQYAECLACGSKAKIVWE